MNFSYNRISGTSVERLAALSDGIFGVAMTLLLLDLHVPAKELIHDESGLWQALGQLFPLILVYLMSFMTLGVFWIGQQTQLNHLERTDRNLTWMHLAFLFLVTLMPFSTRLLIDFIDYRAALIVYWANILLFGALLYASWGYAMRLKFMKEEMSATIPAAVCHRIIIAQSLYAFGALLCIFSTYLSIGFIILVQLNYVIAPRSWFGNKASN